LSLENLKLKCLVLIWKTLNFHNLGEKTSENHSLFPSKKSEDKKSIEMNGLEEENINGKQHLCRDFCSSVPYSRCGRKIMLNSFHYNIKFLWYFGTENSRQYATRHSLRDFAAHPEQEELRISIKPPGSSAK
jgi:hypothetical protein